MSGPENGDRGAYGTKPAAKRAPAANQAADGQDEARDQRLIDVRAWQFPVLGIAFDGADAVIACTEGKQVSRYVRRTPPRQESGLAFDFELERTVTLDAQPLGVAVSPHDGQVAVRLNSGDLALFDRTLASSHNVQLTRQPVTWATYSPNGWLAACAGSDRIWLWTPGDRVPHEIRTTPRDAHSIAWIDDRGLVVDTQHKVQRVDRDGTSGAEHELRGGLIRSITSSIPSQMIAVLRREESARHIDLLHADSLTHVGLAIEVDAPCTAAAFSRDGRFLAIGDEIGGITVFDLVHGKTLPPWTAHTEPVTDVAFHPGGQRLLSSSRDHTIKMWRLDEARPSLPVLTSDLDHGDDALGIERDVAAFARVILARELNPPMAVGIFGDWGTGKSFFLRQMHKRIDAECVRANQRVREGTWSPLVCDTVQITFNAWHYVEGDLWASMMAHLFDELCEKFRPDEPASQTRRSIANELQTTKVAKQAARERHERIARKLSEVRAREDKLRQELEQAHAQRDQLKNSELLPMASKMIFKSLAKSSAEHRDNLSTEMKKATEDWRATVTSMRSTSGRLRVLGTWAWNSGRMAIVFALIAALSVAGVLVARRLELSWDSIYFYLVSFLPPIAIAGRSLAKAWKLLEEPLDAAIEHLEQQRTRVQEEDNQRFERLIAPLTADLEATGIAVRKAEDELALAQAQAARISLAEASALRELQEVADGKKLLAFLTERDGANDYRQHLGTISLIKRDLDTLASFLSPQNTQAPESGSSAPRIDRIVLYIDDLDRCPPGRVVEVLQAVHLLLGMRLFVVVVAIDSRWLVRSLDEHYANLLSDSDRGESRDIRQSSPRNYLEKIFQIPYVLQPMNATGFSRLVASLAGDRSAENTGELSAPTDPAALATGIDEYAASETSETSETEALAAFADAPDAAGEFARPDHLNLAISERERAFMQSLHPLIATPRAVKAFVNIYRLLRARLERPTGDEPSLARFLRDSEYPVALLMLAIQVGRPRQAAALFDDLGTTQMASKAVLTIDEYVRERIAVSGDLRPTNALSGALSASEANAWRVIAERVTTLRRAADLPEALAPYVVWTERVRRFSFDPWRKPYRAPTESD